MKNIYIALILVTGLLFTQCESLLEVNAENAVSGDVLQTEADFENYLTGTYYNFCGISDRAGSGGELIGGDFVIIPELLTRVQSSLIAYNEFSWQAVRADEGYNDFINKDIFKTNGRVESNWLRAYETINQCNHLLNNIDRLEGTVKDRIQGEALAIRGILYFEMAQLWGPQYHDGSDSYLDQFLDPTDDLPAVIIRTEPVGSVNDIETITEADVNTLGEVYDQAQLDLETAAGLLEPGDASGNSRLTHYACKAYLAKLHLQKREFADAADYADDVISGPYSLVASPMQAFNNTVNSSEDIFAIQQTIANNTGDNTSGGGLTAFYSSLTESGLGVYRHQRSALYDTTNLYNSPFYSTSDLRGTVDEGLDSSSVNTDLNNAYYVSIADFDDDRICTSKYTSGQYVLPVVRLAEMYLIRAEATYAEFYPAVNLTQQVIDDINAIRTRAGISALDLSDFTGNEDVFLDTLMMERTREFMHEGMLLEDLKRWGDLIGAKGGSNTEFDPWDASEFENPLDETAEFMLRLPIPQAERDTWGN